METSEMLSALASLEDSLKQITSAREQVSKTVAAYNAVKTDVENFNKILDLIAKSIDSISVEVSKQYKSFEQSVMDSEKLLETKSSEIISTYNQALESTRDNIKTSFDELHRVLNGNLEKSADELHDRVVTDVQLIENKVDRLSKLLDAFEKLSSSISTSIDGVVSTVSDLSNSNEDIKDSIQSQKELLLKINTVLPSIKNDIKSESDNLISLIKNNETESQKERIQFSNNLFDKLDRVNSNQVSDSEKLTKLESDLRKTKIMNIISLVILLFLAGIIIIK